MTQEQILEYNKLCAEFLGATYCNDDIEEFPNGYYVSNNEELDIPHLPEDMEFHSNWNWIMVIKSNICKLKEIDEFNVEYDSIYKNYCCVILPALNNSFKAIYTTVLNNERLTVITAIYNFLKWYNNQ